MLCIPSSAAVRAGPVRIVEIGARERAQSARRSTMLFTWSASKICPRMVRSRFVRMRSKRVYTCDLTLRQPRGLAQETVVDRPPLPEPARISTAMSGVGRPAPSLAESYRIGLSSANTARIARKPRAASAAVLESSTELVGAPIGERRDNWHR